MKQLMMLNLVVFVVISAFSQNTLLPGLEIKSDKMSICTDKDIIPYPVVRQADIMWSKVIWQRIDLREKINQPLYYPIEAFYDPESFLIPLDNRFNLTSLLLFEHIARKGYIDLLEVKYPNEYPNTDRKAKLKHLLEIESENETNGLGQMGQNCATASNPSKLQYMVFEDHEFRKPKSLTQIWTDLGGGMDSTKRINQYGEEELDANGRSIYDYYMKSIRLDQIVELQLKEIWYFDKNRSKMEVRIAGICPVRIYFDELLGKDMRIEIGWFYFPAIRKTLATHNVFNFINDNERRSFDDIFWKRFFTANIYAESNVYNNREIREYKQGSDALDESEKIKNWIFTFEHDLWHY